MHRFSSFPRPSLRLAAVALALAFGCGAALSLAADAPPVSVDISKFLYGPKEITIAPGTTVRWVNHDETPHTVTSAQGQEKVMASKAMDTDDHFEVTFTKEGDFAYFCTVHPFMTGVVHVHKR